MATTNIKLTRVDNVIVELDKRTNAPYVVDFTCPKCSHVTRADLTRDSYLSCPKIAKPSKVYACCEKCDHEMTATVKVDLILTLGSK